MQEVPEYVSKCFVRLFNLLAGHMHNKFGYDAGTCNDIASKSLFYSLLPVLLGKGDAPATEKDWLRMSMAKAVNLAHDERRRSSRSKEVVSLDDCGEYDDGGEKEEHKYLEQVAYDRWHAERQDRDRSAKAKVAMKVLPAIFRKMKTSVRDQLVFCAVVMYKVPVEEVCAAFHISRQQAYTIRYRVCDGLHRHGPAIVEAVYAA